MLSEVKEVSLYSDTVGGQNRNQNVAAQFMYAIQTIKIEVITHNFLENRHSKMKCDSMHSSIEQEKKWVDVYSMQNQIFKYRRTRRKNQY